jgi:WD40 repeat protein
MRGLAMRGCIRTAAVAASVAALAVLGPATAGAAADHARDVGSVPAPRAEHAKSGAQLWVRRYSGPGNAFQNLEAASSVAVSRTAVFVTGRSPGKSTSDDYATVAYNAASGRQLWVRRYNSPGNGDDAAYAVTVNRRGTAVFVTGSSVGKTSGADYATLAYNAATGRQLWVRRYNGPANRDDYAFSLAVNPRGTRVYVTGASHGRSSAFDYATVAYNAATGRQLWVRRYNGPGNGDDWASSVAVSPRGTVVFVTGYSDGKGTGPDYATLAYSARTGRQLWVRRYSGPANGDDQATSLAVSPTGGAVFVTGSSDGPTTDGAESDYATVAYKAATGRQLWVSRYTATGGNFASSLAVNPSGTAVFVTGSSGAAYATVAYSASTGSELWVSRHNPPPDYGAADATAIAVSPTGPVVYVTGWAFGERTSEAYVTIAYNAASGSQLWLRRFQATLAASIAVSPSGTAVFVTGSGHSIKTGGDYATVAYRG